MPILTRREFIHRLPIAAAAAATLTGRGRLFGRSAEVVVETASGKLRGRREDGVDIFKGVPYAGAVAGERRFRAPAALPPWAGIRDALRLGHPALQPLHGTYGIDEPDPAEECLVLNIWTPAADGGKRPVMFYNHGGAFRGGSGGSVAQDGANLARYFDVVVVQTNHRLGLLGFLFLDEVAGAEYAGSGNRGLLDICAGLEWVHDNIAVFGGDPGRVMMFGESGGGGKTAALYAMPAAASWFNKASIESGPAVRVTTAEVAGETTWMALQELGLTARNWRRLLGLSAPEILALQERLVQRAHAAPRPGAIGFGPVAAGDFGPVVDGVTLPAHPFEPQAPAISHDKPLITGWNEDEHTFFAMIAGDQEAFRLDEAGLRQRLAAEFGPHGARLHEVYRETRKEASASEIYMAIHSMAFGGIGSIRIAEQKAAQQGAPVFLYNFGYKTEFPVAGTNWSLGASHALDIQFKFANVMPPVAGEPERGWPGNRPERFGAARAMASMWTSFARSGVPRAAAAPEWPAYRLPQRSLMRIDATCEVINDRHREERLVWEQIIQGR